MRFIFTNIWMTSVKLYLAIPIERQRSLVSPPAAAIVKNEENLRRCSRVQCAAAITFFVATGGFECTWFTFLWHEIPRKYRAILWRFAYNNSTLTVSLLRIGWVVSLGG